MRYFLYLLFSVCSALLVACSTPPVLVRMAQQVQAMAVQVKTAAAKIPPALFDQPAPGQPDENAAPVVRQPRRVKFVDPAILEQERYLALLKERANAPPPANWDEMFKRLPKDDDNNIDWMAALKEKLINPSGQLNADTPDEGKTEDIEVELSTSGKPARMVVFSHAVHTQWLTCTNCHPAIFKKEAGTAKITMSAIDDGKYCGVCHDKVAMAQPAGCKGCHKGAKKS